MLPRHVAFASRAVASTRTRAVKAAYPPPFRITTPSAIAGFHSSSRRQNELPKSPFQTFVDVLKEELRKNRELQDNVKQLQGDVDKFQDSEAMKKARAAYERARVSFCVLYTHCATTLRR